MKNYSSTVIHETCHAFLAWYLGNQLIEVDICSPRHGAFGHCAYRIKSTGDPVKDEKKYIKIHLAGGHGEHHYRGEVSVNGLKEPWEVCRFYLENNRGPEFAAYRRAAFLADLQGEMPEEKGKIFLEQTIFIFERLFRHPLTRQAISACADELNMKKRLTGFEAACIFELAAGARPYVTLPPDQHEGRQENSEGA